MKFLKQFDGIWILRTSTVMRERPLSMLERLLDCFNLM